MNRVQQHHVPRGLLALFLVSTSSLRAQPPPAKTGGDAPAVTQVGRYRLQSNPWVNLHQWLIYEARFQGTPPASLSGEDLARWKKTVEDYGAFIGKRHPMFDDELVRVNAALSETRSSTLSASIPEEASEVLQSAMPLYRAAQWEQDDRVNRFWIAVAAPLLVSAAEELAAAHAKVYGVPFPKRILVDVASFGGEFGAYTVGKGESAHSVISSTNPGTQGFAALESLLHEPSHAIVAPASGAIGSDITRISRELGISPHWFLWHAILFYTSGELTRQALATRGVLGYRPFILDMYRKGFGQFQKPLEAHWQGYLDGKVSREEAIRQILIETAPPKK